MDGEEEGKVKSKEDRQTERHAGADLGWRGRSAGLFSGETDSLSELCKVSGEISEPEAGGERLR